MPDRAPESGRGGGVAPGFRGRYTIHTVETVAIGLDELLRSMMEKKASDLHLKAGRPPLYRVSGVIEPGEGERMHPDQVKELAYSIMSPGQIQRFEETHELDIGYSVPGLSRFRANIFYQRGTVEMVLRAIPFEVPSTEQLGLPEVVKDLANHNHGLILVAGPTGSGKSTTLASMIEHINQTRRCHIITIEEPIEYLFRDKMSTISQREVGFDTFSYPAALKYVLRQDPDVILIGEMRDPETARVALRAAETGHLVLSTLHTYDAPQSVERLIGFFPTEEQAQVRMQLSLLLQGVIAQRLLKAADGQGRVAAVEVMTNSPQIAKLIEEGRLSEIHEAIAKSVTHFRMQTLNQSLVALVLSGVATVEEALTVSPDGDEFKRVLHDFRAGRTTVVRSKEGFEDYV